MSKKKHRHKGDRVENESNSNIANTPFGINPTQLMSMLGGNIDMGQIGNMLSSMKMDGLDLNNFNFGQQANNSQGRNNVNNRSGFDLGALQGMMNNLGIGNLNNNNFSTASSKSSLKDDDNLNLANEDSDMNQDDDLQDDENIQMLIAIKSIVDAKKSTFIDKIIEAYRNGYFND